MLRLIVLPLTQPAKTQKQNLIEETVNLAKLIQDERQQLFAVAGILTATDKFIDRDYSDQIKEWIKMTKVARLFEEEKIDAVNKADGARQVLVAKKMLMAGEDYTKIMMYTDLTRNEVVEIHQKLDSQLAG